MTPRSWVNQLAGRSKWRPVTVRAGPSHTKSKLRHHRGHSVAAVGASARSTGIWRSMSHCARYGASGLKEERKLQRRCVSSPPSSDAASSLPDGASPSPGGTLGAAAARLERYALAGVHTGGCVAPCSARPACRVPTHCDAAAASARAEKLHAPSAGHDDAAPRTTTGDARPAATSDAGDTARPSTASTWRNSGPSGGSCWDLLDAPRVGMTTRRVRTPTGTPHAATHEHSRRRCACRSEYRADQHKAWISTA